MTRIDLLGLVLILDDHKVIIVKKGIGSLSPVRILALVRVLLLKLHFNLNTLTKMHLLEASLPFQVAVQPLAPRHHIAVIALKGKGSILVPVCFSEKPV